MSKALNIFQATLKRGISMFELSAYWHKGCPEDKTYEKNRPVYEDMGRSSVVLAVAAMDAYFTRRFTEVLGPYLKFRGATDDLVELLQAAGLDTKQGLELLLMERPFRRIRALVDGHLERYTTQRFSAIDSLFVCFGLKDLCANAQKKSGRKTLLRSVEILVERRHAIVHGGDYNQHGKLVPFGFDEHSRRMGDVVAFVTAADSIISSLEGKLK